MRIGNASFRVMHWVRTRIFSMPGPAFPFYAQREASPVSMPSRLSGLRATRNEVPMALWKMQLKRQPERSCGLWAQSLPHGWFLPECVSEFGQLFCENEQGVPIEMQ